MSKNGIQVTIDWDSETGKVNVAGPMVSEGSNVFDEPTTFWLLDKAKDLVKLHNKRIGVMNKPQILTPGQN